uniref:Uperolein n=1 Tax=Uperoleia rugosa TaxID=8368 RepID=TKN1_UPERU|nr:RecName: Full=Uperolein [Uperoleia rugosa]pir/S07203/ uperolein - frog (Uperoleia marmorata) [Uperoleia marmorata]
QPDPNAFYGLM